MSQTTELALFVHKTLPLRARTAPIGFVSHVCPLGHPTVSRTTDVSPMAQPAELALFVQLPCPCPQALSDPARPDTASVPRFGQLALFSGGLSLV